MQRLATWSTNGTSMSKRNFIFLFTFIASAFFGLAQNNSVDPKYKRMIERVYRDDFATIQPNEAQKLLGKDNVYFLDTREYKEFEVSHIPGAIWVGYDKPEWLAINKVPRDAHVIIYCSIGARSQNLGRKLQDKGYTNIQNLYGGLFLWANQEREMHDNNGNKTLTIHGYSPHWGKWVKKGKVVY